MTPRLRRLGLALLVALLALVVLAPPIGAQLNRYGATTILSTAYPLKATDGTAGAPAYSFASEASMGFYRPQAGNIYFPKSIGVGGFGTGAVFLSGAAGAGTVAVASQGVLGWAPSTNEQGALDTKLTRNGVGIVGSTALLTAGADDTLVSAGDLTRQRSSYTITPATGGAGNCGAAFLAAALTADCTIATLPAGMKLVAIYADVVTFTCSGTCTGTKVMQAGTAVAGVQVFAAGLNVATTTTYGLADADLGSGLTRAAAIQGGLIGSWASTTAISVRFTSGTGNWGNAATTFVNAGSVKFILITEQIK